MTQSKPDSTSANRERQNRAVGIGFWLLIALICGAGAALAFVAEAKEWDAA